MLTKADLVDPAPRDWVKKDASVGDLMDREVQAVYEDDAALVAAHEMATKNIHRLVVLSTENQLVGIVSTMDIVRAIDAGLTFAVGDLSGTPQVGVL
jgi:predicted transcriptional regulator